MWDVTKGELKGEFRFIQGFYKPLLASMPGWVIQICMQTIIVWMVFAPFGRFAGVDCWDGPRIVRNGGDKGGRAGALAPPKCLKIFFFLYI